MNADAASPTAPAPTAPQPPAPVPAPGATTPPDQGHHKPAEPNALLEGAQTLWANLKAGKIGSAKVWLVVLLVGGVIFLWWFLANQSKNATSAVWRDWALAKPGVQGQEEFRKQPTVANSVTGPLAELTALRLRRDAALNNLTAVQPARPFMMEEDKTPPEDSQQKRQAAAAELEKLREEFVKAAELFPKDYSIKASALLDAADAELALVGIPKAGVASMFNTSTGQFEVQPNSRGQVDRYADLLRKAAEVVGKDTVTGKGHTATADKYAKKDEADQLYKNLGELHRGFNNPDFVAPKPVDRIPPTGGTGGQPGGDLPKPPTDVKPNPDAPKPGPTDAPKPPAEVKPNM